MTHKRNTLGLAKAAQKRRENTLFKVKEAISKLIKSNEPINFNSVSKVANVGKPWLYKEKEVYNKIISFRNNASIKKVSIASTIKEKGGDKSKEHIILMLKEKIKLVESENKQLKKQIEILYGAMSKKICSTE